MDIDQFLYSAFGVKMPRIIYGTAWKKDMTAKLVEQAIRSGFRGIDTACQPKHYDEAGVGNGIASCIKTGLIERAELYLQTKFTPLNGHDPLKIPYDAKANLSDQVNQSFQCSLQNLQTNYLDGLILHSPLADPQQLLEVWRAMEQLFHKGFVKQLGISNCYALETLAFLYEAAEIKPAIVQNRFYAATQYDRNVRAFCQTSNIIYQSFWTLTANPSVLADVVLNRLAEKYRRSSAQIFFRYLTQIAIIPLIGTTSERHMRDDLAIVDFELTAEECQQIDRLLLTSETI